MIKRLNRILKKIITPIDFVVKMRNQGYGRLGISFLDVLKFYKFSNQSQNVDTFTTALFDKRIYCFNNYIWYYHSVEEVFLTEVYKCSFKNNEPLILDCGANIGLSVIYFKRNYPQARVIAFEPDATQFRNLVQNCRSFDLDNVNLINKGVWKESTQLAFYPDGNLGGTVIHNDFTARDGEKVEFVRLKDYMLTKIDFLKLDIEGAEYEVLRDIKDELYNVENLFLEFHGYAGKPQQLHEVLQWVADAGFRYNIKVAWDRVKHPFVQKVTDGWDVQLNIYCHR